MEEKFYTIKEVAKLGLLFGYGQGTIRKLVKAGKLEAVKISAYKDGRSMLRISEHSIKKFIESKK